jgi:hypothetical protein
VHNTTKLAPRPLFPSAVALCQTRAVSTDDIWLAGQLGGQGFAPWDIGTHGNDPGSRRGHRFMLHRDGSTWTQYHPSPGR